MDRIKKCIFSITLGLLFFGTSGVVFAAPNTSGTNNANILGIDEILKTTSDFFHDQASKAENITGNKSVVSPKGVVSNVAATFTPDYNSRSCIYCWIFAVGFAIFLAFYGLVLHDLDRKDSLPKHWFLPMILAGIAIIVIHSTIHVTLASNVSLTYYWMIIFDELIVALGIYHFVLKHKIVYPIKSHNS